MLDILRKRKRSWVIIFFVAIIVFVFALWGVGSYVNDPGIAHVALINGVAVTPREFDLQFQRFVENYRSLFRGALTEEMIRNLNLRETVLEDLIQRRLLVQEAHALGLMVSDRELREAIELVPAFQVDGRFSKNRYLQALRSNRMNPAEFEAEQREQLMIQRLYGVVRDSVQVTEAELKDRYRLYREKLNLHFVRIAADSFMNQVKVTSEDVEDHYERNRESFREPERVQVEYVSYPFEHFSAKVQVTENEIESYYERNRESEFRQPQAVRLRHILIRVPPDAELEQKQRLRAKMENLLQEARAGKDFAQLAKAHSEDASAAQGGEIGWFTQGQLLPALDKAVFRLKQGEISDVVESSLGYHLVRAEETREETIKSLKEATPEIVRVIKAEKGKTEAGKAIDADRVKALSGTELSALAKDRGVPYHVSPWFSRFEVIPDIGRAEAFNKAAFSLASKELAPAVEGLTAYYLVRGKGRREPSIPPLDKLRSEIEKRLRETKAFELAMERAKALLEQLKKERHLERIARQQGVRVEETGWFPRSAAEVPKVGALKEVGPGTLSISRYQPIPDRVYTRDTAAYVIALKASQDADLAGFREEEERLREQLLAEKRQRALEKFLESLKARAKIEVRPEYLERG